MNLDFGAGLRMPLMCHKRKTQRSFMSRDPGPLHLGQNYPTNTNLSESQCHRLQVAACLDAVALFGCSCASEHLAPVTGGWPGDGLLGAGSLFAPEGPLWLRQLGTLVLLAHWLSVVLVVGRDCGLIEHIRISCAARIFSLQGPCGPNGLSTFVSPLPLQALSNHWVE